MASLGSFGVAKPVADDDLSFEFFDLNPRIDPSFGQLDFIDFMEAASSVDTEDPSAMPLLKNLLRQCLHDDDFDAFWAKARKERQDVTDLMLIVHAAVEAVAERPTSRPSDSSDGPASMPENSAGGSSSGVIARMEAKGRPDLGLFVVQRQEALAG